VRRSKVELLLESSLLLVVSVGVLVFWYVTLMFIGVLENAEILDKYFSRPSVYEIGISDDPK
jgi:hypothetical protein